MSALSLDQLSEHLTALRDEVRNLRREVTRLNDIQAIRTLHFKYGYYWDNVLYEQVIDLFSDDVKVPPPTTHTNGAILSRRVVPR